MPILSSQLVSSIQKLFSLKLHHLLAVYIVLCEFWTNFREKRVLWDVTVLKPVKTIFFSFNTIQGNKEKKFDEKQLNSIHYFRDCFKFEKEKYGEYSLKSPYSKAATILTRRGRPRR